MLRHGKSAWKEEPSPRSEGLKGPFGDCWWRKLWDAIGQFSSSEHVGISRFLISQSQRAEEMKKKKENKNNKTRDRATWAAKKTDFLDAVKRMAHE